MTVGSSRAQSLLLVERPMFSAFELTIDSLTKEISKASAVKPATTVYQAVMHFDRLKSQDNLLIGITARA